jgi:hypothetical protein
MGQVSWSRDDMDKQIAPAMACAAGASISKLGLRFDRVVLRLLRGLTQHCDSVVSDGALVLVTISAPIRLPATTAGCLKDRIEALILEGPPPLEQITEVHGNAVGLRLVPAARRSQPRLLGLVHNPEKDPRFLLELLERYAEDTLGADPTSLKSG